MPALEMESQTAAKLDNRKEIEIYIVQKLSLGRCCYSAAVQTELTLLLLLLDIWLPIGPSHEDMYKNGHKGDRSRCLVPRKLTIHLMDVCGHRNVEAMRGELGSQGKV